MEGLVIEVAAVCKGNSEKVCTEDFDQDIEGIKLLQRKLYSLKEALAMFWDYHFFQHSVPLPSRCSLIFNVWWPACLPSLQAQISGKSLTQLQTETFLRGCTFGRGSVFTCLNSPSFFITATIFIKNLNFEGLLFSLTKTHGLVQVKLSAK